MESPQRAVIANVGGVEGQEENFCDLGARECVPMDQSKDLLIRKRESTEYGVHLCSVDVTVGGGRREIPHYLEGDDIVPLARRSSVVRDLVARDAE